MHNKPWVTYSILLVALSNALLGVVGAVPPEHASILMTASIAIGAIGKAVYHLGDSTGDDSGTIPGDVETID